MDVTTLAIVGGAIAAPTLLAAGKSAGAANTAAANALLGRTAAGYTFTAATAAGGELVTMWRGMADALSGKELSAAQLTQVVDAWLAAYRAGAAASPADYSLFTFTLFDHAEGSKGVFGGAVDKADFTNPDTACTDDLAAFHSDMGKAVCRLTLSRGLLSSGIGFAAGSVDTEQVLAETKALAVAMDAADFRASGTRRSEQQPDTLLGWIGDKAAGLVGDAATAVLLSRPVLLVVAGLLVWRVTR